MILDTSFIIDLMRNRENALCKARELERSSLPIRSTAISVFKLWRGAEDIKDAKKRELIEQFLSSIGLLPFEIGSAKIAGSLYSRLEKKGEIIDPEDCMIAGIALFHDETILTRNEKHFCRIPAVRWETY